MRTPGGLVARGIGVRFGTAVAVDGVDVAAAPGGIVAVLGANGAGKSTLARALAGLVPADGSVELDGRPLTGEPAHVRARRGVVLLPEGRGVFPGLTVADNLRLFTRRGGPAERVALAAAVAAFPALEARLGHRAGLLSGGEQQMLALCRALSGAPRLVIADEPSLGLAPRLVDEVHRVLRGLADGGAAVVLVDQFVDRARSLADRAVVLHRGRVAWDGAVEALDDATVARFLHPGTARPPVG